MLHNICVYIYIYIYIVIVYRLYVLLYTQYKNPRCDSCSLDSEEIAKGRSKIHSPPLMNRSGRSKKKIDCKKWAKQVAYSWIATTTGGASTSALIKSSGEATSALAYVKVDNVVECFNSWLSHPLKNLPKNEMSWYVDLKEIAKKKAEELGSLGAEWCCFKTKCLRLKRFQSVDFWQLFLVERLKTWQVATVFQTIRHGHVAEIPYPVRNSTKTCRGFPVSQTLRSCKVFMRNKLLCIVKARSNTCLPLFPEQKKCTKSRVIQTYTQRHASTVPFLIISVYGNAKM